MSWLLFVSLAVSQEPEKVKLCDLKRDPSAFNHKLIQITDFVSHGFEDFTLFDPSCPDWPAVWLEYGGRSKSGTIYCCGVSGDRNQRPKELEVEKITIPLVEDGFFLSFDESIHRRPYSVVHATIVGRFFAGGEMKYPSGSHWGGYGHMGCCSLLAIQQVLGVDKQSRNDLDYSASPDQPDIGKTGCGYRDLLPLTPYADALRTQKLADAGGRDWMFQEPQRVAARALAQALQIEPSSIAGFRETRKTQGRFVYEWKPANKNASYIIVVSRPYWLSFYASDTANVVWIALAAYESSCGKGNSITRIK